MDTTNITRRHTGHNPSPPKKNLDDDDNNNNNNNNNIPGKHQVKELQKTVILGTAHVLRKVLM